MTLVPEVPDGPLSVTRVLELPLRGLAGEGAAGIVTPRLMRVPGVIAVDVRSAAFRVRVTYDPARATPVAIDTALHSLNVGEPGPHGGSHEHRS